MKEASGEANMTVVTIVLIAIVLAAGTFIVRRLMTNSADKAECINNGGEWVNGRCDDGVNLQHSQTNDVNNTGGNGAGVRRPPR